MTVRRTLAYAFFLAYAAVTFSAFVYTMTRIRIPFVPWTPLRFSYAMMAPYQGYSDRATEIVAEGRTTDGEWERIDIDRYFPVRRGEKIARVLLRSFVAPDGDDSLRDEKYRDFAEQLLRHEREKGNEFIEVTLSFEQWPVSVNGYEALRIPSLTDRYPLARASW